MPGADRNLSCFVEYRPFGESSEPDLLFLATAFPYRLEVVYMNLFETLSHATFAPGRHLLRPVRVEGAVCEPPIWSKGHRIPVLVRPSGGLLCKRNGLEQVVIEAQTKYGECRVAIAAGDSTPSCREWPERLEAEIQRIMGRPCRTPHHRSPHPLPSLSAREH